MIQQSEETVMKKMKNKNGGHTNTHNSISRETSVTHTVPPARQGSLTDRICTATTIILHTGILSYTHTHTHTHTSIYRWEETAVCVVHLYHQCVLTLAKCSISFEPSSTETSEPRWRDNTTVRRHETDVVHKGVMSPSSYRGHCSKSTYFALVWHLTNPHRSSADSISVRQQTHTLIWSIQVVSQTTCRIKGRMQWNCRTSTNETIGKGRAPPVGEEEICYSLNYYWLKSVEMILWKQS